MSAKQHPNLIGLVLSLALLVVGCAGPQRVTLADGRKVSAAPSYVSAAEMKERGKNSFGVPASSFVFYPERYEPGKTNATGNTREEFEAFKTAAIAEGRPVVCYGFTPSKTPAWDSSFCDSPAIRHDCFSMERLFLVPWGSSEQEIGKAPGSEIILFPSTSFSRAGNIAIWDRARERILVYDQAGQRIAVQENAKSEPGFDWDINADNGFSKHEGELEFLATNGGRDLGAQGFVDEINGTFVSHNPGEMISVVDLRAGKVICRVYFPDQVEYGLSGKGMFDDPRANFLPVLYPEGYVLFPHYTEAGLEILRYRMN